LGGRWWWVDKRSLETKEPPGDDEVGEISKSKTETIRRRRGKRWVGKMYGIFLIIQNLKKIIHIFTMKLFQKAKTQFHCLLSQVVPVSSPASPGDGLDIETTKLIPAINTTPRQLANRQPVSHSLRTTQF
jgi:hypothetical protein